MAQPMPRVRNACEACHKRKQRCILPDTGGSCHACRQNARHCFFVPRVKPGKQRRDTMERQDLAGSSDSSGTSALSDTTPPFSGLGAAYDTFVHHHPPPRPGSAVADHDNSQQDMDGLWDPGFNFALPGTSTGLSSPLLARDETPSAPRASQEPSIFSMMPTVTSPCFTTTAASLAAQFIELDAHKEMLQKRARKSEESGDTRSKVESALLLLAKACPQALDMTTELGPHRDLCRDAIVTGTMIRAFDLCDLILSVAEASPGHNQSLTPGLFDHQTEQSSSGPSSAQLSGLLSHHVLPSMQTSHVNGTLKLILMLKQLELNLTQAKMCLTFLAPSTSPQLTNGLANRSANLHKRINAMVGEVCA